MSLASKLITEASDSAEKVIKVLKTIDPEGKDALTYQDIGRIAWELRRNHVDDVDSTMDPNGARKARSVVDALKALEKACE